MASLSDRPNTLGAASLSRVLPVFQTPYHEDETIDWNTLDHELNWLLERGAAGVVMAMVSEILRMSTEERKEMTQRVCQAIGNRGATIISVGAESSYTAVALAQHSESCGATAVMAIPPVSIAISPSELVSYFSRLIESISIPVVVQDASGYLGKPMPVSALVELLDKYGPQRVMFKPEAAPIGPNLSILRDATRNRACVFEGTGGIALVDSYRRGIVGTMPGADLIDGLVALWKALESGDESRIYRLSLPISSLVALQSGLDGFLAVEKYLLKKQGIFKNTVVRGPVGWRLDDETRKEVDRLFALLMQAVQDTRT